MIVGGVITTLLGAAITGAVTMAFQTQAEIVQTRQDLAALRSRVEEYRVSEETNARRRIDAFVRIEADLARLDERTRVCK